MYKDRIHAVELFCAALVALSFAVVALNVVGPLSKRWVALVSDHIAAHPSCSGTHAYDATGFTCILYQAASAQR